MDSGVQKWHQKSSLADFKIQEGKQTQQLQQQSADVITSFFQQFPQPKAIRRVSKRNLGIKKTTGSSEGQIFETFEIIEKKQQKNDISFIVMCLKMHFVFSSLSDNQLQQLATSMFYCKLSPGQTIIKQGDNASSFFILEKGRIQVLVNNVAKKELITGNGFGELALLYSAPRSATCTALEECLLWGIDRHTFRKSVEQIMIAEQEKNRKYIENVKIFTHFTEQQKDQIASVLISQKFPSDQMIVNEGDQASSFYIIAQVLQIIKNHLLFSQGKCGVFKDGKQVRVLNAGESFGEQALISDNSVRQMTIKAVEGEAKVLALGRDMVQKLLGDQMQSIIYKNSCKWAIQKSKLFQNLPSAEMEKLLEGVQFKQFKSGQKLISKGEKVSSFAIVVEGSVNNSKKQRIAQKGELIDEESITNKTGVYQDDIFMEAEGVIGFVDYEQFRKLQGTLEKQKQDKSQSSNTAISNEIKQKDIKDFVFISKLGQGQFGSVFLIKLKANPHLFALKYVTRAHIQQFGIQKHIQQEKTVLEKMDHVFILKFFRSYKDTENIYFLTEYIAGIELFDAIRVIGLLSKYDAQFYAAQMLLMMEYLHSVHHIVYRDIKPENLMVDDKGYLKLIDMGTAKELKNQKTFTIIGTPHYMAPEVISGKGYNYNADLWSIGVCLYEFICGGLPFGEEAEDPFDIYQEIVKNPLTYPAYMADKTAKPFIEQLMNKTAELRLGGSYSALKQHAWFKGWDFEALLAKTLKPPLLPPKDKLFNPAQLDNLEKKNISVVDQITKETAAQKRVQATAKDQEWDSMF